MTVIEQYVAPTSLEQALACLQAGEVTILAGGTDLMPQSRAGRVPIQRTLMNIRRIAALQGIARAGAALRIGALTTITELMEDALVKAHFPVLVEAGDHFASEQIRNAGTVGGNIGNASPAGDTLVPLMVLDAEVELASHGAGQATGDRGQNNGGEPDREAGVPPSPVLRRLPLAQFFTAPGRTRRKPDELLTAVHIPLPPPGHFARFFKFGARPALDISTISIGMAGVLVDGVLRDVRIAFGAVAPTPVRAPRTEAALEGRRLDDETIAAAANVARDEVRPIDDVRATAWYRQELIHNMTKRMLADVAQS